MDRKVFNGKIWFFIMMAFAALFIVTNIMQVYSISFDYGLAVSAGYYLSFIVSADGAFTIAVILFALFGLLYKGEKTNVLKGFMWTILAANLYYGIPMLASVTALSAEGGLISNILLLMMVIPQVVLAVAVAAQLYSFGRCHKSQAVFSWISVYTSLFFFVFHIVYLLSSLSGITSLYAVSGQLICVGLNGCILFFSWFMLNVFKNEDNLNAFLAPRTVCEKEECAEAEETLQEESGSDEIRECAENETATAADAADEASAAAEDNPAE